MPLTSCSFQLLAALKQPAAPATPAAPPVHVTPAPGLPAAMPPMPGMQQTAPNPYYTPQPTAPAPYPGGGSYMGNLPPPSTALGGVPPANPALANLPPNILALLQSAQQQQQRPSPAPGQNYGMAMNTAPPAAIGSAQSAPGGVNPQYQQLMAYLVSLTRYRHFVAYLI